MFVHIYSDGCNGFRVDEHTFTRPPSSYKKETSGVWRDGNRESFYVRVPGGDPVEPVEDEDEG